MFGYFQTLMKPVGREEQAWKGEDPARVVLDPEMGVQDRELEVGDQDEVSDDQVPD
jgi:hypothetical protein